MSVNIKDKLITLESLGVAYSAEQDAREAADLALSTRIDNIVAPEYVTPEMFGAVGDGTTDDTNAMAQAFASGKPVVLTKGKNYFLMQITVTNPLIVIGNQATISTRSITSDEYSNGKQRLLIFDDSASDVSIRDVRFYTTADQTIYGAHGSSDPAIPNRSMRCAIAAYGVDRIEVVNCTFENFDNPILGQRHGGDSAYEHVVRNAYLKDLQLKNSLMGVMGYFQNIVIDGCEVIEDHNARSGEHCVYLLVDAMDTAIITNSDFYTHDGDCGSCIQFYPSSMSATLPTGKKREYRIDGCLMFGDAYVSNAGGGNCYVSACTMKIINYNTTNRRRQFECAHGNGLIEVSGSVINLELQDRVDQNVIYRNCILYSNRVTSDRFSLYKAYECQFDNIGFKAADGAEVVNCAFSSSTGVLGKYYLTVPSTTTASSIVGCLFNEGANVDSIAYQCAGACTMTAPISELPIGNDNPGLTVIHKIDSSDSGDSGGGSSGGSIVLYNGTANIVADSPNYVAIPNISTVLTEGDTYRVTWNGIVSVLTATTATVDGASAVVIGNPAVNGGTDDGSGLTYVGHKYSATVLAFATTDATGSITLKVEKIVGEDTSLCGNALFIGDSICLGYNNDNISFVDILASRNFFASVTKKAAIGCSTSNFTTTAAQIPTATWALADIVYLCITSDDMDNEREIGAITDTTATTVSGSVSVINDYIRSLNTTCAIVWLNFTKTNWRRYENFVSQLWLKRFAMIAMHKAHALNMSEIPYYDVINDGLTTTDHIHPNMDGHKMIANLIQTNPYGDFEPVIYWPQIDPIVIFDGVATVRSGTPNYALLSNVTDTLNVGDVYRVTWNGVTSTLTAKSVTVSDNTAVVIGNPAVDGGTDDGSGLTYCAYKYSNTSLAISTTDATGSIPVKIEKMVE